MIEISDDMAREIINITDALQKPFEVNDTRSANVKRRAKLIIKYLEKKNDSKKKKKKETKRDYNPVGVSR